jgi:outer membrane biosynthesis protein TonB
MSEKSDEKILRIGLIQNGKIVEERLLRSRDDLTIGRDFDKNTLVVPVSDLPKSYPVFENRDGQYVLNFTPEMEGRLSTSDGVESLDELQRRGRTDKGEHGSYIEVDPSTRGRVQIGDVTLLFQFVVPPPTRPAPALPASMRGGWIKGLDATLVGVVGLSALLQIGFIVYLESQDWPQPKKSTSQTLNRFVKIKQPDQPEQKKPDLKKKKKKTSDEGKKKAKAEESTPSEQPDPDPEPKKKQDDKVDPEKKAEKEAERQRKMAKEVRNKTILGQIGTKAKSGEGTVANVLENGVGKKNMEEAFENSEGITSGSGAEKSGLETGGSADADGSGKAAGIGDLDQTEGAKQAQEGVETGEKQEDEVQANVDLKSPAKTAGTGKLNSDSISRTIKRYSGRIQRCYERQLKVDSKASGKVVVNFTIGKAGRVTQAKSINNSVGGGVGGCVASVIQGLRFPRPKGGSVIVNKSFVFEAG